MTCSIRAGNQAALQQQCWLLARSADLAVGALLGTPLLLEASRLSDALLQATTAGLQLLAKLTQWLMGAPAGVHCPASRSEAGLGLVPDEQPTQQAPAVKGGLWVEALCAEALPAQGSSCTWA